MHTVAADKPQAPVHALRVAEPTIKQEEITHADALVAQMSRRGAALTERRAPASPARTSAAYEIGIEVRAGTGDRSVCVELGDQLGARAPVRDADRAVVERVEGRRNRQAHHRAVGKHRIRVTTDAAVEALAAQDDFHG